MGQPGCGRRLPQPGQLTIGEELLGCHNNNTTFLSIQPHRWLTHVAPAQHPVVAWWGLETSTWSSSYSLDRPTSPRHWICPCQPPETGIDALAQPGYAMTTTVTNVCYLHSGVSSQMINYTADVLSFVGGN